MTSRHVVLLGDSIFDNGVYTGGAPDVVTHLRGTLGSGWRASLLAVDGSTTRDLGWQLGRVPGDATHVVLSVGGNDALGSLDMLDLPVASTAAALQIFGERAAAFRASYASALAEVVALGRPTTVCTIYEGNLEPPLGALARTALVLFNDVILRAAVERGLDIIELRLVCTEASDYANPIEPSGAGGAKIARAIAAALGAAEGNRPSRVTGRSG